MVRINRGQKKLELVFSPKKMADVGIWEKRDLQEYLWNSFEAVAAEVDDEDLLLIGKEVQPSKFIDDRIDLLAVDRDGTLVIIELKRSKNKLHLLQAISYMAMISRLTPKEVASLVGIDKQRLDDFYRQKQDDLESADDVAFNTGQRILLIAEEYDFEVLVTAEWLEKREIEIKCARVTVASDNEGKPEHYLNLSVVFPPKEIEEQARVRKSLAKNTLVAGTWPEFLNAIENGAEREFLIRQRLGGEESGSVPRTFRFRIGGITRFEVWTRPSYGYAEQKGRFNADIEFWQKRLSDGADVHEVFAGRRLRFRLFSSGDFQAFENALTSELESKTWEARNSLPADFAVSDVQST